ncbi:hypothetical protein JOF53_003383 [Crossiella equi]|uniref:Uncharacterized protein n=1 Tax=Crossiella equi TaxID=130796 RepID=A0ABS5AD74_9PSEU|nr:hypothetical protein [Crossiella equi]MBP2474511.1 hypothetical protein [Crossiella equi]
MKSLKKAIVIGALALGLPVAVAGTASAAEVGKPINVLIAAVGQGPTVQKAVDAAQKDVLKGLADFEKEKQVKCKPDGNSVEIRKIDKGFEAFSQLKAVCVKK